MLKPSRPNMDAAMSHPAILPPKTIWRELELKKHDEDFVPAADCIPTGARPGSIEKIQVMRERLEAGQPIFHRRDENRPCTIEQEYEKEQWMANNSDSWEKRQQRQSSTLRVLSQNSGIRWGDLLAVAETLLVPYRIYCLQKIRYDLARFLADIESGELVIPQTRSMHRPRLTPKRMPKNG